MYALELSVMGTVILVYFLWLIFILIYGLAEYITWFHRQIRYHLSDKRKHNSYENCGTYIVNDSKVANNISFNNRSNDSDNHFYDPEDVLRSIHCEGEIVHRSVQCEGMEVSITISTVDEHLQSLCHNKNQTRAHRIWRRRRGKFEENRNVPTINDAIKTDNSLKKEESFVNTDVIHDEEWKDFEQSTCMFYNVSCHDEFGRELTLQIKSNESQIIKLNSSRHRRQKLKDRVENRGRTSQLENRKKTSNDYP